MSEDWEYLSLVNDNVIGLYIPDTLQDCISSSKFIQNAVLLFL